MPSDLVVRFLPLRAILQIQTGALPSTRTDPRPDSARSRPISPYTNWSSIGEIPTRLDLEEEEVIEMDDDDDDDDDDNDDDD